MATTIQTPILDTPICDMTPLEIACTIALLQESDTDPEAIQTLEHVLWAMYESVTLDTPITQANGLF